ncbi:MAG: hypothetical protein ACRDAM_08890 [Casimicrobium sp.]
MPTYPALRQIKRESRRERISGLVSDEGGDKSLWVRNMAPVEKFSFTIVHVLTSFELAALDLFYMNHKTALFDFVMNDNKAFTYTNCLFLDAPQFIERYARGIDKYQVRFRQR